LDGQPVPNDRLAEVIGVDPRALSDQADGADFTYWIDEGPAPERILLRPRRETGRRFDIARLIGDRAISAALSPVRPVTKSYRARQKFQRAFAAEFLCPLDRVLEMTGGDYSEDMRFNVSEMAVQTMLVNNGYLERETLASYDIR
jgi:hypothetical protein